MNKQENISKLGYIQSFIIAFALIIIGIFVELLTKGKGVVLPGWPINFVILLVFIIYLLGLNYFWKSKIKTWLSSIRATVGAITMYAILVLLMGFIPQIDDSASNIIKNIGFSHINRSWEFLFLSMYLLIVLGLVSLRRLKKWNFRNIAFFLNHLGIWIVIAAASLGTGDLQRLTLPIYEGESSNVAYKNDSTYYNLPFTIKLNSFTVDEFTPNVIIFNPNSRQILNETNVDYTADTSNIISYKNYKIKILKTIENAVFVDSDFIEKDTSIAQFASLIEYSDGVNTKQAWISSGNYLEPSSAVYIDNIAFSLSLPEEKKFTSVVDIDNEKNIKIEVNAPYKTKGYNVYQQGFDKSNGYNLSILEIVKDPWLPVVYVGLIMLVIGSTMLLWLGKEKEN